MQDFKLFISNWTGFNCRRTLYGKLSMSACTFVWPCRCNSSSDYSFFLQIDSGLMTPTMKIRRDKVVARYKEQIDNLFKWSCIMILCLDHMITMYICTTCMKISAPDSWESPFILWSLGRAEKYNNAKRTWAQEMSLCFEVQIVRKRNDKKIEWPCMRREK